MTRSLTAAPTLADASAIARAAASAGQRVLNSALGPSALEAYVRPNSASLMWRGSKPTSAVVGSMAAPHSLRRRCSSRAQNACMPAAAYANARQGIVPALLSQRNDLNALLAAIRQESTSRAATSERGNTVRKVVTGAITGPGTDTLCGSGRD
jgi:hypothetical protein